MAEHGPVLYLLPAPLWPGTAHSYLTGLHRTLIQTVRLIAAENVQRASAFLQSADSTWKPSSCLFFEASGKDPSETKEFLDHVEKEGKGILVSDAGMPCIADPGHRIVREAHRRNIRVVSLPGPVSFMMALAASGLSGQQFCFMGYPPCEKNSLARKISEIAQALRRESATTYIFMETPQRAALLFATIMDKLPSDAMLCLAQGLQSPEERIHTLSVAEWKQALPVFSAKLPCVFLIGF